MEGERKADTDCCQDPEGMCVCVHGVCVGKEVGSAKYDVYISNAKHY